MLKLLDAAPADLGKKSEITRESGRLDRITGDTGDLSTHQSTDGKRKYLRVWVHENSSNQLDNAHGIGAHFEPTALWFEVTPAPEKDPTKTK